MGLAYKQLLKQIVKDKIFVLLLLLLTMLTSLLFFFPIFSIDGNIAVLNTLPALTENEQLYKNALGSNTTLAYNFFASLIGLTTFVFVMFFYRFYRSNKKQIGCIVGVILIFLALYVNFQDNTRDMLILHMMGYRTKHIRKLLIDVYMPIVWTAFLITLAPSILLASSIQKSLSISTNDYMPFGTNFFVVLITFVVLHIIYWLVQAMFGLGVRRIYSKRRNIGIHKRRMIRLWFFLIKTISR